MEWKRFITLRKKTVRCFPIASYLLPYIPVPAKSSSEQARGVSYQSDATEAKNSFRESNVRAYPNPVRPDYSGVITVTGMVYDSDVKIVDTAGHLIYQGTSLGGQFIWDGRNKQGRRVATGIYMVLAADSEGKEGIVTKIAFIRGE